MDDCVPTGGLMMICSDSSTRSYVLNGAVNLKIFSSPTGYASITGSTGACEPHTESFSLLLMLL
jgi:hypothetical protein